VDLRTRKGKEGENYTMGSLKTLFTIKQTVYSDNNTTIVYVYDIGILLRQHVSVILSPIFRPTCVGKRYNQCLLCTMGSHNPYKVYAKAIKNKKNCKA